MRIYSVHVPPLISPVDRARVVAEGFSWAAFVLGVLFALWHRQWLAAVLLVVAGLVVSAALGLAGAGEVAITIANLAVSAIYGVVANDLRRRRYARLGWREISPIAATDGDEALYRAAMLYQPAAPAPRPGHDQRPLHKLGHGGGHLGGLGAS